MSLSRDRNAVSLFMSCCSVKTYARTGWRGGTKHFDANYSNTWFLDPWGGLRGSDGDHPRRNCPYPVLPSSAPLRMPRQSFHFAPKMVSS